MHGRGGQGLEEIVDLFPGEIGHDDRRQRLKQFARELDELVATEGGGDVVVDQDVLERLIAGEDFPADLHELLRREARGHLGPHLKERPHGRKLKWHELAEHGAPIEPMSVDEIRRLGIDSSTSVERAKELLRQHYPDLPGELLEADGPQLRELALRALAHNRTVWDCCVAHLGWWGALWVFALVGALLIVGTATGPWGIPLAIFLISVLGAGTGVIVMNCVLNPNL
jgi:hypothetical protein